ncbi:hypothetical protein [Pseudomonas sp. 460]|nr:hypothetical protein [Pseudomonas sp. 460]TCV51459.1 hypothetical protein EDB99_107125 [Pseudomonas sp. 460]
MPILRPFFVPLPPLSDAQVEAGALPGESWEQISPAPGRTMSVKVSSGNR